jgi:hypothetical protein
MSRMIHMSISTRGALRNWNPRFWRNCVTDGSGHTLTPDEVKDWLLSQLAMGREKVPMDPSCDNFDYQSGCMGHDVTDEVPA